MALYFAGQLLTATIGRQLLTKAIVSSSSGIYGSVSSIYMYSKDINNILEEIDIKNKVKTIESVCEILHDQYLDNKVIDQALEAIHDIILKIRYDLKSINKKLAKHQRKYFNGWRKLNIKSLIQDLRFHTGILDKRYELLANTITLLK
jgi:hypothetical protein